MPPRTTIERIIADSMKVKLAGLMKVVLAAKMTPTIPAQVAPRAKAVSLVLRLVDPHRLAGDLVFAQRDPGPADPRILQAVDDEDREEAQGDHEDNRGRSVASLSVIEMPKNPGRGILAMPLGPKEKAFQFSRMRRMISPKPSVTMAR